MAKAASYYGTGRRKKSIARVYLVPGKGDIIVNKRNIDEYFGLETLKVIVRQPLVATETTDKYDVLVNVHGGGLYIEIMLEPAASGHSRGPMARPARRRFSARHRDTVRTSGSRVGNGPLVVPGRRA